MKHVQYTKRQKEIARAKNQGLVCIAWISPEGISVEWMGTVNAETLAYVKKAQQLAMEKAKGED